MQANESIIYYHHDYESSSTLNLLIELVTLLLIIFTAIYINYKRHQRDERADETLATYLLKQINASGDIGPKDR